MAYVSDFLTQSSTTGGATVVLTLPPHVTNDIIVVCVSADGGGTLSVTWGGDSTATGQVGTTQVSGALLSGAVFYARATGTAATATVNMGTADAIHVHMVILKDVDTTTHLDASNATVGTTATEFTTASITTNTADCLILYYVAGDDATTTPHAIHSRPGPTATMHFLDSSDNGGTTVTTLASGALGWYIQRAITGTPQPQWDQSSTEVYASFVMAWRNQSGGLIPPYADDSASLGQQLMTGSWFVAATTRNNQNFKATPLTFPVAGPTFVTTATSGTGTTATITFATQSVAPFAVGSSITVAGGITPTAYAQAAATVTASTTSTVSYANTTTGAQTVPGTVGGTGTTFDAGAAVVDAGLNPYSSAINSTPIATTTIARGFELTFPTAEYDMTTGWVVGAFQASTSKMALLHMAAKMTYDTTNKLFILNNGVTSFDVVVDLYSDAKEDWLSNALLNKFRFPIVAIGGQGIGGGQVISPYIMLRYGWKIRPQEADHTLTVAGNLITDDETSPFTSVLGDYQVIIKSIVSANSLTAGVAISASDLANIADKVWDEAITGHLLAGSTGRTLKDTKTRATLASLK